MFQKNPSPDKPNQRELELEEVSRTLPNSILSAKSQCFLSSKTATMSSWLSISLSNPFKSDDQNPSPALDNSTPSSDDHCPSHAGGAKEDLSVLGETIGRQLRGVASFLAPPPSPQPPPDSTSYPSSASAESSSQTLLGIKNDLVEIGGSFKSSLSLFSSNKAVSGISRFASNLLQFESEGNGVEGEEEDDDDDNETADVAGVTEEVLDFVEEISLRPECWTDFPLSLDYDFDMSDVQKEHASTVEHLVPSLAALRHKTCSYLSEEKFWMIYFIFLLPRLHEHDAKLLSTSEIVEARGILLQKLQNKSNAPVETSEDSQTYNFSQEGGKADDTQREGRPSRGTEVLLKAVNAEQGVETGHENTEEWLEEADVEACTSASNAQKQPEDDEDVSFSDLEDNDNDLSGRLSRFRSEREERAPSPDRSNEWVQLNENSGTQGGGQKAGQSTSREKDSEGEESNDWLTVDKVDLDSLSAG